MPKEPYSGQKLREIGDRRIASLKAAKRSKAAKGPKPRKRLPGAPSGDRKSYMAWYMAKVYRPKQQAELERLKKIVARLPK